MGILKQKYLEEMEEEAAIEEEAEEIFLDTIADKEPDPFSEDFDEEEAMIQAAEDAFEEAQIEKEIARQEKIQALVQEKLANFSAGDMPGWGK